MRHCPWPIVAVSCFLLLFQFATPIEGQPDRSSRNSGTLSNIKWNGDGKSVTFKNGGKYFEFNLETLEKKRNRSAESGRFRFGDTAATFVSPVSR